MQAIRLEQNEQSFFLTISKEVIDKDMLVELVERIRLEYLLKQADFDQSIEDLGEEIKADWWKANKDKFIVEDDPADE